MKYSILFYLFIISIAVNAQYRIANNGCVSMMGDASITNNGATWNAFIENNCDYIVKVSESVFKVKLQKTKSDGKTSNTTKKIKFPDAFMAPGTTLSKDRRGSDGSSYYSDVLSIDGELGGLQKPFNGRPNDFNNAFYLSTGALVEIGSYGPVKIYASITKAIFDGWVGFDKYKVVITFENTAEEKIKEKIHIKYVLSMSGITYEGDEYISKIKGKDSKTYSDKFDAIFNYTPDIFLKPIETNIQLSPFN